MKSKTIIIILLMTLFYFVSYAKPNHSHSRPSQRPNIVKHIHRPHHIHKYHIYRNPFGGVWVCPIINHQSMVITTQPIVVNPPLQKVWVNGYWVTEYNKFGIAYQKYIPGHWEYR